MKIHISDTKPALYLISTPIGNLKDITFRAIETLEMVDVIYAEDTRVTLKLLNHYNIKKPLRTYHSHNEDVATLEVIKDLREGLNVALTTDAGTPGISDPGFHLVRSVKSEFPVVSIPGASAVLTALVSSGLIPQPFTFVGFLDRKKNKRIEMLKRFDMPHTVVFYERADRIEDVLSSMEEVYGKREVVIARELTKKFETFYRFDLGDDISDIELRGEFVVMVSGRNDEVKIDMIKEVNNLIENGLSKSDAIKAVATFYKVAKNDVYQEVIKHEK